MPVLVLNSLSITPGSLADFEAGYASPTAAAMLQVSGADDLAYRFPYAPVQVEFSKLAAELEEVERPGSHAIIAERGPQLMRAAFQFRIAHRPSNGLQPVNRDMDLLRAMAGSGKPVMLLGVGGFFDSTDSTSQSALGGLKYRIVNLDLTVIRRGTNNEPWQVDADIELIEDHNPVFSSVNFVPFVYADAPIAATPATGGGGGGGGNRRSGGGGRSAPNPPPRQRRLVSGLYEFYNAPNRPVVNAPNRRWTAT